MIRSSVVRVGMVVGHGLAGDGQRLPIGHELLEVVVRALERLVVLPEPGIAAQRSVHLCIDALQGYLGGGRHHVPAVHFVQPAPRHRLGRQGADLSFIEPRQCSRVFDGAELLDGKRMQNRVHFTHVSRTYS